MKTIADLSYGPHGERNQLDLYLPDDLSSPCPLVVMIHGGGWAGQDKGAYPWMPPRFTAMGLAAASITYRFWPQWRCPAAIEDAARAVRWLRRHASQYALDSDRIGAIGGSAGGHLASCLALLPEPAETDPNFARFSSRVGCVVDCYGPVDLPAMMTSASAPIVEGFMGMPLTPQSEPAYRAASPIHAVAPDPPPFLIAHGSADIGTQRGQVPLTISQRFAQRLQQAGGQATLLIIPDAPHGFLGNAQGPHVAQMWPAAQAFFEQCLLRGNDVRGEQ